MVTIHQRPREASWIRSCDKGQRIEWGEKATYNKQDLPVHSSERFMTSSEHIALRESTHVNDCGMKYTPNLQKPRRYSEGHERSWSTNEHFTPRPNVNHWSHR